MCVLSSWWLEVLRVATWCYASFVTCPLSVFYVLISAMFCAFREQKRTVDFWCILRWFALMMMAVVSRGKAMGETGVRTHTGLQDQHCTYDNATGTENVLFRLPKCTKMRRFQPSGFSRLLESPRKSWNFWGVKFPGPGKPWKNLS